MSQLQLYSQSKSCLYVSVSLAAVAVAVPGSDSPCTHGSLVPVTDLSNGDAQ